MREPFLVVQSERHLAVSAGIPILTKVDMGGNCCIDVTESDPVIEKPTGMQSSSVGADCVN